MKTIKVFSGQYGFTRIYGSFKIQDLRNLLVKIEKTLQIIKPSLLFRSRTHELDIRVILNLFKSFIVCRIHQHATKLKKDSDLYVNKFLIFDVMSGDLVRQVYPGVTGLMLGLELSKDNKYAAAYTSNNQVILLNILAGEFILVDNPFTEAGTLMETVTSIKIIDGNLIVIGQFSWSCYSMAGKQLIKNKSPSPKEIFGLEIMSTTHFTLISRSGTEELPIFEIRKCTNGTFGKPLSSYSAFTINQQQNRVFTCKSRDVFTVHAYTLQGLNWKRACALENYEPILMLSLSTTENWCIATLLRKSIEEYFKTSCFERGAFGAAIVSKLQRSF